MPKDSALSVKPGVTLSVVSHGDSQKVAMLLESLRAHEPGRQFQIILTDNLGKELPDIEGNAGGSIEIIRNERPQGFARNHNQAFKLARTDYFCILNPDVIFPDEVFDRLISTVEMSGADVVAPLIVDSGGSVQDSFRALPRPLDLVRRRLPGYHPSPIPPDAGGLVRPEWIAGTFMLLKNETYGQISGFDEKYHLYFEDVDFCTRARLLGLRLLVDTRVQLQHDAQRTSQKSLRYLLWHLRSAIRFYSSGVYRRAIRM